jgi:hypothetical protein
MISKKNQPPASGGFYFRLTAAPGFQHFRAKFCAKARNGEGK